jgi:hypothetical protein
MQKKPKDWLTNKQWIDPAPECPPKCSKAWPWESVCKKALTPKRDDLTAGIQTRGDLVVGHAFGGIENHLGALYLKIR